MNIIKLLNPITLITESISSILGAIDKLFTSDEERLIARTALLKIKQHPAMMKLVAENLERTSVIRELELNLTRTEISRLEAQGNWFQRGWRPAIGYISAVSLLFASAIPLAVCSVIWSAHCIEAWKVLEFPVQFEVLTEMLATNLISLLGMSYLRTREKEKNVQHRH